MLDQLTIAMASGALVIFSAYRMGTAFRLADTRPVASALAPDTRTGSGGRLDCAGVVVSRLVGGLGPPTGLPSVLTHQKTAVTGH